VTQGALGHSSESEWLTRKRRIDPLLDAAGWPEALLRLPRPDRTFVRAGEYQDTVSSVPMLRDSDGQAYKPEDYLAAFSRFVTEN